MNKTPVIGKLPTWLIRNVHPPRTPLVRGVGVPLIGEMMRRGHLTAEEMEAAVDVAGAAGDDDPILAEASNAVLMSSCALFASEKLRGPKGPPYNGHFILGQHHVEWDELLTENRVNILAARDHGKSYFWTFAYPIWRARFWKGCMIYIFSATQQLAESFLKMIKDEILENEALEDMIPATGDRFWSAKEITTRQGSRIRARGYGVKVRGGHPDYIVCDDVLGDDDIYSETIRRKNIDYYLSSITNMIVPGGQIVVVGTPMHQGDLYHELTVSGEYVCKKYPALDKSGKPLFPERYNAAALEKKKRELKSAARFAREFMCEPLSDEASLFPLKLFEGPEVRLPYVLGLPAEYWEKRGFLRYSGVDIALSAEVGSDFFWIFTVAVDPATGVRWIVNLRRHKGMSFTAQVDAIKDEAYRFRPEVIHIEANQAQRVWSDEVERTTDIRIRRFFTTGVGGRQPIRPWKKGATQVSVNKHHIDRGVPGLRMGLEAKKWRIPRGDAHSIELTDLWIGEMSAMGWIDGKVMSVAEHDDSVMACWMADAAVRMGGVSFGFLEDEKPMRQPVLAAPEPSKLIRQDFMGELVAQERRALASIQEGQRVECSVDAYFHGVRNSIQEYTHQQIECGNMKRAAFAAAELRRLDAMLKVGEVSDPAVLAKSNSASYGGAHVDGAPTPLDLGLITE